LHYHITHNPRLEEDHLYPKQPSSRISNHHLASAGIVQYTSNTTSKIARRGSSSTMMNSSNEDDDYEDEYNDEGLENPRQQGGHQLGPLTASASISPTDKTYAIDV
jgi:hypothetical protein